MALDWGNYFVNGVSVSIVVGRSKVELFPVNIGVVVSYHSCGYVDGSREILEMPIEAPLFHEALKCRRYSVMRREHLHFCPRIGAKKPKLKNCLKIRLTLWKCASSSIAFVPHITWLLQAICWIIINYSPNLHNYCNCTNGTDIVTYYVYACGFEITIIALALCPPKSVLAYLQQYENNINTKRDDTVK